MSLKISKDLSLPDEAVTQTFAILAKRGVGKTYTASVMVEEMLKNNLHVAVVDPIGVWWGLRTSADGKKAGLPIIVLGGEHGDVPLEPTSGEVVANLIVDQDFSVVIDLSLMRKGEQKRFMIDFAETLYHRNRSALHVVLDEADEFAPQRAMGDDNRMLGAIEDLVRRGRARGIGLTLITQRPAVLNKNVLTQIEVLVAMRLTSPQDRNQIAEWVKFHADSESSNNMLSLLSSLPIGTAWFWSPGWLDIFQKVQIRKRETLDSSSTPKIGEERIVAGKVAKVDIAVLREQLAATIEKVEADDPKILRRRIIELERELAEHKKHPVVQIKEVPVVTDSVITDLQRLFDNFKSQPLFKVLSDLQRTLDTITRPAPAVPAAAIRDDGHQWVRKTAKPDLRQRPLPAPKASERQMDDNKELRITGGAQRMLDVLGSRYPMMFTKAQLAALTKMSPKSGTYSTYFSLLRSNGLIEVNGQNIGLTDRGREYVGDVENVPQTTAEVLDMWRQNLTGGARRMFDVLVDYYPAALERNQLGELTEMSSGSGTFGTYLSTLRRNGLIEVEGAEVKANDALFVGGKT